MCLARILDNSQSVALSNGQDTVHVRGTATDVDGHNGLCSIRNRLFNPGGIHALGLWIDVNEDRDRTYNQTGRCRSHKCIRRDDHLIAIVHPDRP